MKFKVEVDCTPEEARTFLGLPDLAELQKGATDELMDRLRESVGGMDPEGLMKTWFGGGDMKGWEQMQKSFWSAAGLKIPSDDADK
jgi:hypothetical protein